MPLRNLWLCVPLLLLAAGCTRPTEPPLYAAHFDQIRPGMARLKVQELLGEPNRADYRKGVTARPAAAGNASSNERDELARSLGGVGGTEPGWSERWQYGRFSLGDIRGLIDGSDKAFIVWFDENAAVIRSRKPLTGPFAATTRPAAP